MKSKFLLTTMLITVFLVACDSASKKTRVYHTDEAKEERLYLACLDAMKVRVKAGEDNLEDAITSCRTNANAMSSKLIYVNANPKNSQ